MSKNLELTAAQLATANAQARALTCLQAYEARPMRSTRRALHAHRELMLLLGLDSTAAAICDVLWFSGN